MFDVYSQKRQLTSQVSDAQNREMKHRGQRLNLESEIARPNSDVQNVKQDFGLNPGDQRCKFPKEHGTHQTNRRVDRGKEKLREDLMEVRNKARSKHASTDSEKQEKIYNFELQIQEQELEPVREDVIFHTRHAQKVSDSW